MFSKFGFQAYSMRDYYTKEDVTKESLTEAFKKMKSFGYDEVQTAGYGVLTPEEYAIAAKDAGLKIVGTHVGFDGIEEDPDEAMRLHKEVFGTNFIGIGSMPLWARQSKDELLKFIDKVNAFSEYIGKYGFKFTYHNHSFEFTKFADGKRMIDYLVEGFDRKNVSFCLDTYWVQFAGGSPTEWIKKLSGRIDILHLKDMATKKEGDFSGYITEIGQGNMDFDSIVKVAEESKVKYYCVEQDTCPGDPLDSLKLSADYIKAHFVK